jgi:hypothetical protein
MTKPLSILILFTLLPILLFSQGSGLLQYLSKNWKVGGTGGVSYLTCELKKNFDKATMDMISELNVSFTMFLNKRFTKQLEAGIEFEKCYFSGYQNHSEKINWLVYDRYFNNENSTFLKTPVYYTTDISSWYINFCYNFLNVYSWKNNYLNVNLFVKAGVGFSSIGVDMGYKNYGDYALSNLKAPLYQKGHGTNSHRDTYGTSHAGFGFNYYFSDRISVSAEWIFLFVSADYLDGVHNFDVTSNSDGTIKMTRIGVYDAVSEIRAGVCYHFQFPKRRTGHNQAWYQKNDKFRNEFFYSKRFNKVVKPFDPYSVKNLNRKWEKDREKKQSENRSKLKRTW